MQQDAGWLVAGEGSLPEGLDWLSPAEHERAAAMRFPKRRGEYLLRRWAGKLAVGAAEGAPRDVPTLRRIEIANRDSGAPYPLLDGHPLELELSLTDRAGWAVCLVGSGLGAVGCDLELVETRSEAFVEDYLTTGERRYVGADRDVAANLVWSAKECVLKVLQTGLEPDPRSVEVTIGGSSEGRGWQPFHALHRDTSTDGWWRREGRFVLTVAAERPLPQPRAFDGSADLGSAVPVHSWVE